MTAITPAFSESTPAADGVSPTPVSMARSGDILGSVMVLGKDDARVGSAIGIGLAALIHGYVVVRVLLALISMASWVVYRSSQVFQTMSGQRSSNRASNPMTES